MKREELGKSDPLKEKRDNMPLQFVIPHASLLMQKKNLLAFSAGIDSSALFFMLIEAGISFDIAMVDYGLRAQSRAEVAHAKALAKRYNLRCYTVRAPEFQSHFEEQARIFRYRFFEEIIRKHGYRTLLTAHQLDDQLEWLLMRLSRGAGVAELVGMEAVSRREGYTLIRPLLDYSKESLLSYLQRHGYPYFVDESNHQEQYERNRFRKHFCAPLMQAYSEGIRRSLRYLREDAAQLQKQYTVCYSRKQLRIIRLYEPTAKSRAVDSILKQFGYLLSAAQRREVTREESLVIGGVWAIEQQGDLLYIAPYLGVEMPKHFREQCRVARIPAKIRPYLYQEEITLPAHL